MRRLVANVIGDPSQITLPESASSTPSTTRIVVVLPAPFAPTNPKISPGVTVKLRSWSASRAP